MKSALVIIVDMLVRWLVRFPASASFFYALLWVLPMRSHHRERAKILATRISRRDKIYEMLKRLAGYRKKCRHAIIRGLFVNTPGQKKIQCGTRKCLPPHVLNIFVTNRCNCDCPYCFVKGTHQQEMSDELLVKALDEANGFPPSFMCLSGGEPFMRENLLDILGKYPKMLFIVFTNGLCLDEAMCARIADLGNVMLMFSLDGLEATTARKRNPTVWPRFMKSAEYLRTHKIPFGFSCHLEQDNFDECLSESFVDRMVGCGCSVGWYAIHVPMCGQDVQAKVPTPEQRLLLLERTDKLRGKPILLIDSSSDSRFLGSCSAGGALLCHIEANGDICPCQFLPFSVGNIADMSVADAMGTCFFTDVRELGEVHCAKDHLAGCVALDKRRGMLDLVARHSDALTEHSRELARKWESYQPEMDKYEETFANLIKEKVTFRS